MKTKAQAVSILRRLVPSWDSAHRLIREKLGAEVHASYFHADGLPKSTDAGRALARAILCAETGVSVDDSYGTNWSPRCVTCVVEEGESFPLPIVQVPNINLQVPCAYGDFDSGLARSFMVFPQRPTSHATFRVAAQLRRAVSLIDREAFRSHQEFQRVREFRARGNAAVVPLPLLERLTKRPLTPDNFNYTRAVGMEFEGFSPIGASPLAARLPFWSRLAQDGSIRPADGMTGHEVRALFPRELLEVRLHRLLATLKDVGFRVNASCGFHVHFDMRGRTEAAVLERAKVVDKWLFALRELVPTSRRDGNTYCKFGVTKNDRYRAVNIRSFETHKTLEVRLHSGTVDYTKVLAWVRLCELLLALRRKPKDADCLGTLAQLPLAEHDVAYWRERHRLLNPSLYRATSASVEVES